MMRVKLYVVYTTKKPRPSNKSSRLKKHHNERWCHDSGDDLVPEGDEKIGRFHKFVKCVWCGHILKYTRFMDAAGSMDWDYR
jgi:hypothetical protein